MASMLRSHISVCARRVPFTLRSSQVCVFNGVCTLRSTQRRFASNESFSKKYGGGSAFLPIAGLVSLGLVGYVVSAVVLFFFSSLRLAVTIAGILESLTWCPSSFRYCLSLLCFYQLLYYFRLMTSGKEERNLHTLNVLSKRATPRQD